jgi:L-rhamnose-H+ transport protein
MQVILGVIFHFIGGFASGSFYILIKSKRMALGKLLDRWRIIFMVIVPPLLHGSLFPVY